MVYYALQLRRILSAHRFGHSTFTRRKIIKKVSTLLFLDTLYISGRNFLTSKNKITRFEKIFLYFGKWNFKKPLYFRRDLAKSEKQTKKSPLKKFLVSHDVFTIFTAVKHREIKQKYDTDI